MEHPVKLQREVKGAGNCNCAEEILEQVGLVDAEHQAMLLHQVQVHLEHLQDRAGWELYVHLEQVDVAAAVEEQGSQNNW